MLRGADSGRLNEYFFTVGPALPLEPLEAAGQDDPDAHPVRLRYRPELIDRFPLEDSKDTRIENGISDFCFPNGLLLSREIRMPKFFCFVLTNAEGDRTYGNCLIIWEILPHDTEAQYKWLVEKWQKRPKRALSLSGSGGRELSFVASRSGSGLLVAPPSPKGFREDMPFQKDSMAVQIGGQPQGDGHRGVGAGGAPGELNGPVERGQAQANGNGVVADGAARAQQALSSVGVSSKELSSVIEDEEPIGQIFMPKCLCLLSKYPYINASRTWLMQLYRLSLSPTQIPLERYICNFLLEVPCPVLGRVDIQYSMLDQVLTYPSPTKGEPYSWVGLNFAPLFECLSLDNIVQLFNYVLLEQQVLLHSSQLSLLVMCAEFMTSCLYPLNWCHVYIPVLPRQCLYIPTNSPVPFLLGFHSDAYNGVKSQLPDTVVVVDMDNNIVTTPDGVCVPPIPERRRVKLIKTLKESANLFDTRDPAWREHCLATLDDPFTQSRPSDFIDPTDPASATPAALRRRPDWDAVRDAFLGFFVAIMKEYRKFVVYPSKENPRPMSVFRQHEFIASHPQEWAPFLDCLCKTQAFQSFIDSRQQPDPDDVDGAAFDDAIETKATKSRFSMSRRNTPFYKNKSNPYQEIKTVVALQPDTSRLPEQPFEYSRFPNLQECWFVPPRPVVGLMGQSTAQTGGRRGRRKRNNILRFKTDHVPADPATVVFSSFIMAYAPTIGRDLHDVASDSAARRGADRRASSLDMASDGSIRIVREDKVSMPQIEFTIVEEVQDGAVGTAEATDTPTATTAAHAEAEAAGGGTNSEKENDSQGMAESSGDQTTIPTAEPVSGEDGEVAAVEPIPVTSVAGGDVVVERAVVGREGPAPMRIVSKLRPRMRRLSEDLKEERLHAANGKLTMAFDVLQRMKNQSVQADEWIYRSLIDASSRLGNVELAVQALMEMHSAGFMPDASIYSCLVGAFAMKDKSGYQSAQPLAMLDWNKLRSKAVDPRPKSLMKLDMKFTSPRVFKDAMATFRKMTTPTVASPFWSMSTSGSGSGQSLSQTKQLELSPSETPRLSFESDPQVIPTNFEMELDDQALLDAERVVHGASTPRAKNLKRSTSMQYNSSALKYQVLYGDSLLNMLFPNLVIDTDAETCPDCNVRLSPAQIQMGWLADPNNYTTQCPLCTLARQDLLSDAGSETSTSASTTEGRRRPSQSGKPPLRRFVARFSVHCLDPEWIGSTGPGTPLWCEYLPPWVMRKELATILLTDGIETLLAPSFRKSTQSSATVFWNMILWFKEFCLPVSFLLQDSVDEMTHSPERLASPERIPSPEKVVGASAS